MTSRAPSQWAQAVLMLALEPTARWAAIRVREQTAALREEAEEVTSEALALGELSAHLDPADCERHIVDGSRIRLRVAGGSEYRFERCPSTYQQLHRVFGAEV